MDYDPLEKWRRTHYSSEISPKLDGKRITVFGWVEEMRDLGGLKFLVLRDKEGIIQITAPSKEVNQKILFYHMVSSYYQMC